MHLSTILNTIALFTASSLALPTAEPVPAVDAPQHPSPEQTPITLKFSPPAIAQQAEPTSSAAATAFLSKPTTAAPNIVLRSILWIRIFISRSIQVIIRVGVRAGIRMRI